MRSDQEQEMLSKAFSYASLTSFAAFGAFSVAFAISVVAAMSPSDSSAASVLASSLLPRQTYLCAYGAMVSAALVLPLTLIGLALEKTSLTSDTSAMVRGHQHPRQDTKAPLQ